MDCQHEEGIFGAACIKSSQIGLSEILNNDIGYSIDWEPCPMLLVQPTKDLTEEYAKDRIKTLFRDNPRLRKKIRENESTITNYRFDGGFLAMGSANTPRSLAGKPIRKVYLDEIDGYPASSGIEGDPVDLARARTKTFPYNRFVWAFSTPTIKKLSRIEAIWEKSDQRRFFVECPHCQQLQFLKWRQVKGLKRGELFGHDPDKARYHCENEACKGEPWSQDTLQAAVQLGRWFATKPENRRNGWAGFHIWQIYSPWSSMREIVQEFLDCKNIPDRLRVWKNTCLGECDEIQGEGVPAEGLESRREDYGGYDPEAGPSQRPIVPEDVLVLVGSIDVQKDRLEVFVCGFGMDEECWAIQKLEFNGDPLKGEVWDRAESFLLKHYKRADGVEMKVASIFVDSSDKAPHVYAFTKPRQKRGVYAVKGSSYPNKPIVGSANRVGPRKVALFEIGTDTAKDTIFGRLGMPAEKSPAGNMPGYIHFPKGFGFDHEYFEQLTAEKYTMVHRNGVAFRKWENVRSNKRNEALDLMVYAFAAFYNLKADLRRVARKLEQRREAAKATVKPVEPATGDTPQRAEMPTEPAEVETVIASGPRPEKKRRRIGRPGGGFLGGWKKF